jgi:hypothetical protein
MLRRPGAPRTWDSHNIFVEKRLRHSECDNGIFRITGEILKHRLKALEDHAVEPASNTA